MDAAQSSADRGSAQLEGLSKPDRSRLTTWGVVAATSFLSVLGFTFRAPSSAGESGPQKEALVGGEALKIATQPERVFSAIERAPGWLNTTHPLSATDLAGRPVLIYYWGAYCRPCQAKLPDLNKLQEQEASKGLVVLGLVKESGETLSRFFAPDSKNPVKFPVAVGATEAWNAPAEAVTAVPRAIVIDARGTVRFDDVAVDKDALLALARQVASEARTSAPVTFVSPNAAHGAMAELALGSRQRPAESLSYTFEMLANQIKDLEAGGANAQHVNNLKSFIGANLPTSTWAGDKAVREDLMYYAAQLLRRGTAEERSQTIETVAYWIAKEPSAALRAELGISILGAMRDASPEQMRTMAQHCADLATHELDARAKASLERSAYYLRVAAEPKRSEEVVPVKSRFLDGQSTLRKENLHDGEWLSIQKSLDQDRGSIAVWSRAFELAFPDRAGLSGDAYFKSRAGGVYLMSYCFMRDPPKGEACAELSARLAKLFAAEHSEDKLYGARLLDMLEQVGVDGVTGEARAALKSALRMEMQSPEFDLMARTVELMLDGAPSHRTLTKTVSSPSR